MSKLELTRLWRSPDDGPCSGDSCPVPGCGGKLRIYCTRPPRGGWVVRFFHCGRCSFKPTNNKRIDPEQVENI